MGTAAMGVSLTKNSIMAMPAMATKTGAPSGNAATTRMMHGQLSHSGCAPNATNSATVTTHARSDDARPRQPPGVCQTKRPQMSTNATGMMIDAHHAGTPKGSSSVDTPLALHREEAGVGQHQRRRRRDGAAQVAGDPAQRVMLGQKHRRRQPEVLAVGRGHDGAEEAEPHADALRIRPQPLTQENVEDRHQHHRQRQDDDDAAHERVGRGRRAVRVGGAALPCFEIDHMGFIINRGLTERLALLGCAPTMRRLTLACVLVTMVAGTSGCLKQLALGSVANALSASGNGFGRDDDPELIRDTLPVIIKLMEQLHDSLPKHQELAVALTRATTSYGVAFLAEDADRVEEKDVQAAHAIRLRARHMLLRARKYGLEALDVSVPGLGAAMLANDRDKRAALLAKTKKSDVAALYWTAAAWGSAISNGKEDLEPRRSAAAGQRAGRARARLERELRRGRHSRALHQPGGGAERSQRRQGALRSRRATFA